MKSRYIFYFLLIMAQSVGLISTAMASSMLLSEQKKYEAQVVYTEYGIPHITADDYGSLGYAIGYTSAKDHICNIAYAVIIAQGVSASYLGAGENNQYLISDTVVRAMELPARAAKAFNFLRNETKQAYIGYAKGFNRYVSESGTRGLWCEGETWVKSITAQQLFSRSYYLAQTVNKLLAAIYFAQPEVNGLKAGGSKSINDNALVRAELSLKLNGLGSNAWAIGKDLSKTGRGMLLANPHYPWFGTNRFWEVHLTIPDQLNIYGVSLLGIPSVLIGFNENIGWSHTVSKSQRVAIYELDLVNGKPTQYLLDGKPVNMLSKRVVVEVLNKEGELTQHTRNIWFSHHGPLLQLPGMKWNNRKAYTGRDANYENFKFVEQWFDMARAETLDAFIDAHRKWNAMPWVNTVVTSRTGNVAYLDNSTVGNLSNKALSQWFKQYNNDEKIKSIYDNRNIMLLDGSRSLFDWVEEGNSPIPGTTSFYQRPQLVRKDYVFNANDSYWISNPRQPLNDYSPLYGPTDSPLSLRSRMNIQHLESSKLRGLDGKFSLNEIQQALLSNQSSAKEIFWADLVKTCQRQNTVEIEGEIVDLEDTCDELAEFNGLLDKTSEGAVLFREWLQAYHLLVSQDKLRMFKQPFNADNPIDTPFGLGDENAALRALVLAARNLKKFNLPLDAPLELVQIAYRGNKKVPIHGGLSFEGVVNMINNWSSDSPEPYAKGTHLVEWSKLTDKGYVVSGGSSFILALAYGNKGPVAQALLSYGQSGRLDSEHYWDQTVLFSNKKWRPVRFFQKDIKKYKVKSFVLRGE